MFTPPPSPDPRPPQRNTYIPASNITLKLDAGDDPFLASPPTRSRSSTPESHPPHSDHTPLSPKEDPYTFVLFQKKRAGRRIRWTVVLVPLILVFVALSTRYLSHPAAFDILSSRAPTWAAVKDWTPHKRHAAPEPLPATTAATTVENTKPSGTSLSLNPSATAEVPTQVNSGDNTVPWAPPVLPTPFPQPFDSTFSPNFSTVGCQNFMTNMTLSSAFRECRAFSLLVGDSNAFISSQRNISELNVIIWGTCNTDLSAETCASNMAWFEENIHTACKQDIAADNALVNDAVAGLQSYSLMRQVGCQVNQQTNTYCYVEAAQSTHPSDLYLYQLPLGLALPNTTVPSCTACVQSMMGAFAQSGANGGKLAETYPPAANIVNNVCGSEFVAALNVAGDNRAVAPTVGLGWAVAVAGAVTLLVGQLVL